ncbi:MULTISPECIES: ABC transporter permease [Rhizobium/Agrobacterium group]|uniref:ABC transporter permease n=1 Tax=Rhizobium/Agrobacterium group TaxID=227290 RepID=UPI0008DC05C3|nr:MULTISPECIES: ABC transporter permease [Rhizobium/Agrobacterium group]MCF1435442.1 ABC transporter permease [Allorhizobium ampelinum]MCF1483417.1 ABC transporter permease [Allorhizobium ampelinum]MUO88786.1 FtsX-like permease family protein [Agrobacterium vitis]MUZ52051.1 FtsX-like permease family protein [Agrobacterium vitis]MUZ91900.1 FtsX-like permease family protein [Agrobacterium vitis]
MIRFILADLRRLWAGALVVCLLVALSTALGVTVTLQERALRLGSARAADKFDLVIGAAGSETQLVLSSVFLQPSPLPLVPGGVLATLQTDPRVEWAAPVAFGDSFSGYPIVGTTTRLITATTPGFAEGQMFAREGEAVVGADVKLKTGDTVKPMHGTAAEGGHTHGELAYHVVGRLKATGTAWDRAILVPVQAVWHIHGLGEEHEDHDAEEAAADKGEASHDEDHDEHDHHGHIDPNAALSEQFSANDPGVPAILVKPKTIAAAYKLRQDYRNDRTLGVFPGEVLTRLYATLGDAKLVLSFVAIGAQALVAGALLLVTVVHIGQRRKQIGALRAFGAPRSSVFLIVWCELFSLFLGGIGFGVAMGYAAARIISQTVKTSNGFNLPVEFASQDGWQICAMLVFAGLLSALPAWLAYRQSPVAALRS